MATNKHATIRYHALDRCFSNYGRSYFIEDLIDACNEAIYEFAGITDGVKRRQVFDDIRFMESEQGWSIPLERIKDGKRVYYRYADKSFSIKNQGLNQSEAEQLRQTLSILSRFKGLPQFEWVEEMQIRLEDTFKLKGNLDIVVGFEQNPYLKGLQHFTPIFNAIKNKRALTIQYQGFRQPLPAKFLFHPWYLKQYNNRWFLFGWNEQHGSLSNLAIDRILKISESNLNFRENLIIDFEEYFEDAIGVSINQEQKPVKVILEIKKDLWPYIHSKPLHGSQKTKIICENYTIIELMVLFNYELISTVFSFGDGVKVIEPLELRTILIDKAKQMLSQYE